MDIDGRRIRSCRLAAQVVTTDQDRAYCTVVGTVMGQGPRAGSLQSRITEAGGQTQNSLYGAQPLEDAIAEELIDKLCAGGAQWVAR